MAITIKKYEKAWRLRITEEEWEYVDLSKMEKVLNQIIKFKEEDGNIR